MTMSLSRIDSLTIVIYNYGCSLRHSKFTPKKVHDKLTERKTKIKRNDFKRTTLIFFVLVHVIAIRNMFKDQRI